jgi:uncharacterized protein (TIRG00374 family)
MLKGFEKSEVNNNGLLNGTETTQRIWGWPTYLSIAVTILILICLVVMLDLKEIWRQIAACDKRCVLLGGLAHYATYVVRGLRWRLSLAGVTSNAGWGTAGLLVFFYNFVDNVVPAKLADVYAAHLARINFGIRRSAAMGSIVFLRMIDAWFVLALASLSSWLLFSAQLPRSVLWSLILGSIIALGATSILVTFVLTKNALPRWIPEKIQQMIRAFQTGMWPRASQLIPIALLTLIIWALETLWIVSLVWAFDVKVNPVQGIFLTAIPVLASAFPLTPSGTGAVELTLFSCLRILGVSSPVAASMTVMNRLVDYWLHIGLGALTWAFRHVIGIRTWREVPRETLREASSLEISVS